MGPGLVDGLDFGVCRLAWGDGEKSGGDDHADDVVGQFTDVGTALTGSTTYDPFGKVLATQSMVGALGYQSEWTDPDTSQVDMAARWYNPDIGQFSSRDTVANSPVPDSVDADRFAYGDDNPLTNTDPTGHWSLWGAVKSIKKHASHAWHHSSLRRHLKSAARHVHNFVKQVKKHGLKATIKKVAKHYARKAVKYVRDHHPAIYHYVSHTYHRVRHYVHRAIKSAARHYHSAVKQLRHAAKAVGGALKKAKRAADKFIKKHKTAIVATLAVLAVAGAVTCVALTAGACLAPIAGAFAEGAVLGEGAAVASAGISAIVEGGSALWGAGSVVAGGGAVAVEAGVGDDAAAGSSAAKSVSSGAPKSTGGTAKAGGGAKGDEGGGLRAPKKSSGGSESPEGNTCTCPCSFSPETKVLMKDGKAKAIGKIKVGDKVESASPKTGKHAGARDVQHVWVNHDRDLLDLTVRTKNGKTATLHTTSNHPFWDDTTHRWVAAGKLHRGDALNTSGNGHVYVVTTRITPGEADRWNLTVQELHTYYVEAGNTPVLVHNCDGYDAGSHEFDLDKLDDIDAKHGPQVADGVEYQIKRMHDGSASSADHELPGIGHDPDTLADFFAKFKNRQFTHYDPRPGQGSSQAEALHITMKEGEDEVGVVVLRQTRMIHAYRMTEEDFNRIYKPKGP